MYFAAYEYYLQFLFTCRTLSRISYQVLLFRYLIDYILPGIYYVSLAVCDIGFRRALGARIKCTARHPMQNASDLIRRSSFDRSLVGGGNQLSSISVPVIAVWVA